MKKYKIVLLVAFLLIGYYVYSEYPRLNIISGYSAKNMCSCLFEADRSQTFVETTDNDFPPVNIASYEVDTVAKTVTASVYGLMKRTAVYHDDLGCKLLLKDREKPNFNYYTVPHNCPPEAPYPYGSLDQKDTILPNVNYDKLNLAVTNAFDIEGQDSLKTRTLLVIHKDQIIAEKYDKNFDKKSIILGWSMAKSLTATLFGILERQGKLDLNKTNLFPEWENDDRANITLNALLQMNSGLDWDENYNKISDVTEMLFLEDDMTQKQKNKPLKFELNNHWIYSSGISNLLSGYLRKQFATHEEYLDFPVKQLYDKLAMPSMLMETDLAGNYVASSYAWGTTRDWAKLGLLYLHRGNWNGEQIINESWVDYASTPCAGSNGEYGAHFWLNAGGEHPDLPKEMYFMDGYQGQRVFIFPSKDLVVVRMGLTGDTMFFNKMLKEIVAAVE